MDIRFTVTIDIKNIHSEAEAWRLFNAELQDGHGRVETEVLRRDPCDLPANNNQSRACLLPKTQHETVSARIGDTMPCVGVLPVDLEPSI